MQFNFEKLGDAVYSKFANLPHNGHLDYNYYHPVIIQFLTTKIKLKT